MWIVLKRLALIITILVFLLQAHAAEGGIGGKIGISFQFGTHIQRIGAMYQLYYFNSFIQASHGTSFFYNGKSLGPPKRGLEMQTLLGLQFYWGQDVGGKKYLHSEYSLMSLEKYSAGIMFKYYLDQIETSQSTGGINFNIDQFGFVFENDLFGGPKGIEDKFRTGALGITYRNDSLEISLKTTHWTGIGIKGIRVQDSLYNSRYGYRDLSKVPYGKHSHGILALGINYIWKFQQTLRLEAGVDAEQVRHGFQNRLVYDFMVRSKKYKYQNPHYPMLQPDGTPYTFREGQTIRKPRFYMQGPEIPLFFTNHIYNSMLLKKSFSRLSIL
ncbi:MAG TPA: hypothetical protein ENI20_00950 [Bacteroides sp.]|nr:hypothetical protein [Bacteroides sp.]